MNVKIIKKSTTKMTIWAVEIKISDIKNTWNKTKQQQQQQHFDHKHKHKTQTLFVTITYQVLCRNQNVYDHIIKK